MLGWLFWIQPRHDGSCMSQKSTDGSQPFGSFAFISEQGRDVVFTLAFAFGVNILVQWIVEFLRLALLLRQHWSPEHIILFLLVVWDGSHRPRVSASVRTAKLSNPPKSKLSSVVGIDRMRCYPSHIVRTFSNQPSPCPSAGGRGGFG
eukprot:scaffold882_cov384-Pavlova_lutheri.AAC.8